MPDYRKTLPQLRSEWADCTRCDLGVRRIEVDGEFVFGEGQTGGIMFVGEGPGATEEVRGRPFIGRSGAVLRKTLGRLGLTQSYITNVVCCRSCRQAHDSEGQPMYKHDRELGMKVPVIRDCLPTLVQVQACLPRLYEEIYLVDPILIVALGAGAAKTLLKGSAVPIVAESGKEREIEVPGAWANPVYTKKKGVWLRKVRGEWVRPTEQNAVRYLMIPLMHPAYVLRQQGDQRLGNPLQVFVEVLKKVAAVYRRYRFEVYGEPIEPPQITDNTDYGEFIDVQEVE